MGTDKVINDFESVRERYLRFENAFNGEDSEPVSPELNPHFDIVQDPDDANLKRLTDRLSHLAMISGLRYQDPIFGTARDSGIDPDDVASLQERNQFQNQRELEERLPTSMRRVNLSHTGWLVTRGHLNAKNDNKDIAVANYTYRKLSNPETGILHLDKDVKGRKKDRNFVPLDKNPNLVLQMEFFPYQSEKFGQSLYS